MRPSTLNTVLAVDEILRRRTCPGVPPGCIRLLTACIRCLFTACMHSPPHSLYEVSKVGLTSSPRGVRSSTLSFLPYTLFHSQCAGGMGALLAASTASSTSRFTSFSMRLSSLASPPCVSTNFLMRSMGSLSWRMVLISSRVRYVDPGSDMEWPWYLYVSISRMMGPFSIAYCLAYAVTCFTARASMPSALRPGTKSPRV
mmetsp:Transcript_37652/g.83831  ORF Transcript_37652/g.83831 Transcript_37652/m.83831 type:complete len:200 (+) Transcript_37652:1486-2085(+)